MKKLFNFRPVVLSAVLFICGILCAAYSVKPKILSLILPVLLVLLIFIILSCFYRKNEVVLRQNKIICLLCLVFFLFGYLDFGGRVYFNDNFKITEQEYAVTCKVEKINDYGDYSKVIFENCSFGEYNNKKIEYDYCRIDFAEGEVVEFSASVYNNPAVKDSGNDYAVLINGAPCLINSIKTYKIKSYEPDIFQKIKRKITNEIDACSPENEAVIIKALLIGDKSGMDNTTLTAFRLAGVAHIFAVSGLHIGYLAAILALIFLKIPIKRYLKAFIIGFALFFYSGICGFSPSSVRAAVMSICLLLIYASGLKYDALNSLGLSALLLLIYNSAYLFDVGFLLSYAAVIGIIILTPPIKRLLKFLPNKLAASLAVVISAQISVIPICADAFKYITFWGFFINLFLLPVVSVVYVLAATGILIALIFPFAQRFALDLPNILIFSVSKILKGINYTPLVADNILFGKSSCFYYGTLLILSDAVNLKARAKLISAAVFAAAFVAVLCSINL